MRNRVYDQQRRFTILYKGEAVGDHVPISPQEASLIRDKVGRFNVEKIKQEDIVASGGVPDEE